MYPASTPVIHLPLVSGAQALLLTGWGSTQGQLDNVSYASSRRAAIFLHQCLHNVRKRPAGAAVCLPQILAYPP